jgi:hypothetical protein
MVVSAGVNMVSAGGIVVSGGGVVVVVSVVDWLVQLTTANAMVSVRAATISSARNFLIPLHLLSFAAVERSVRGAVRRWLIHRKTPLRKRCLDLATPCGSDCTVTIPGPHAQPAPCGS